LRSYWKEEPPLDNRTSGDFRNGLCVSVKLRPVGLSDAVICARISWVCFVVD